MTTIWVLATGSRYFWRQEVVRVAFDAIEADFGWNDPGPYTYRLIHGACPYYDVEVPGPDGRTRIVHGSADMLAEREARRRQHWAVVESAPGVSGFPADWRLGRKAGPVRNQQMIQFLQRQDGPKIVVGFPQVVSKRYPKGASSGTRGCLKLAENAGLRWWVAPLDMDTADLREEAS